MTIQSFRRANKMAGLPVLGGLLWIVATGCSGAAPEEAPLDDEAEAEWGQLGSEFRHGKKHGSFGFPFLCGGRAEVECRADSVCLPFVPRGCPGPRRIGMCVPKPRHCPPISHPVCGCDGITYANFCEAAQAGASVEHRGECAPSGEPVCGGAAGEECAGAGVCVDDPSDDCVGRECPGTCECKVEEKCDNPRDVWDSDPRVCGCVPAVEDPCEDKCPPRTECIVQDDGTAECVEPS